jgi:cytidyltransferase-like protein
MSDCGTEINSELVGRKYMSSVRRAMFIGRWQPLHNGHKWLINQKLDKGISVLIAVRDIPPDEKNPFTTGQTIHMLERAYESQDVEIISIPDIESVNYGRGVGYEINEYVPPFNVGFISATDIRQKIKNEDNSWKQNVDGKIHDLVKKYLLEAETWM